MEEKRKLANILMNEIEELENEPIQDRCDKIAQLAHELIELWRTFSI
ncbi:hypothetical protein [Eubacterium barkeri]|uniref:Uncharacterized protein n=1 Tax=Eubacterium barkeri TaxID=1528 RepID=A0A1H3BGK1_EUBBA|nr:hypothetical protein [Eubacterium barkeri]SDX41120.1 hypothetical protein SAMN04488579_10274 [Eubacterium barkeri]